jgi:C-terminal peptidase prc
MTKSKSLGLLALFLLALFAAVPARAAVPKRQAYVVLIGIDKYPDKQILPRAHAEADAQALYDLFASKEYLGVAPDHIRLLLGGKDQKRHAKPATRANILNALTWLTKAGADDLVILAIIGQGAPLGERACYFASDATFKGRAKDAVPAQLMEKALNKVQSRQFCAFIDVNFKGFTTGKDPSPQLSLASIYREFLGKEDEEGQAASRAVFLSNFPPFRPSLDLKDHGLFTQVLLDGLKGKADTLGDEADGRITVEELAKYVSKEVAKRAKELGKTAAEKKQRAVALQGQEFDFTLTRNPSVMATVNKRLARIAELAKEGTITKAVALQGKHLLDRMPKLKALRTLRTAYKKLADGKLEPEKFLRLRARILARTKLDREEARDYAVAVLKAARIIKVGYVKPMNQGQLIDWAVRGLYRKVEEKIPPGIKSRLTRAKTLKERDLRLLLTDVRQGLGKREDLAKGKDVTFTLNAMTRHLDGHTEYISPEMLEPTRIDVEGEYYGIGAQVRVNTDRDMLEIVTPIMGSPAYRAKLYAGDIITTIIREVDSNGKPLKPRQVISTKGLDTDKAVKLIKGKKNTKVKLVVERAGESKPLEFEITRGRVEMESVVGYKRKKNQQWNYYLDPRRKIAYIRVSQFARWTYRDLQLLMKKLSRKGIGGLVLDLRFNPGGLLDSAVKVSDLFIDDGVIVTIKRRRGQKEIYVGKHAGSYLNFPMVCLVNDMSASGSEIVSACLQDHNRAVIMGERSYGKGSVQQILPFPLTGGRLKMTNATFWRPNGRNLNKASTKGREQDVWGVTPDEGYELKLQLKEQIALEEFQREQELIKRPGHKAKPGAEFKDRQLDMALKYLRGQIKATAKKKVRRKSK